MKKSILITSYGTLLTIAIFLTSCSKDSIVPPGGSQLKMDTTWVDDSTGGFNFDFLPHGNSGVWNDSTWTNPNDSIVGNPGGVGPIDSIWINVTPHGGSNVWDSTWVNPNDSLGGGN